MLKTSLIQWLCDHDAGGREGSERSTRNEMMEASSWWPASENPPFGTKSWTYLLFTSSYMTQFPFKYRYPRIVITMATWLGMGKYVQDTHGCPRKLWVLYKNLRQIYYRTRVVANF